MSTNVWSLKERARNDKNLVILSLRSLGRADLPSLPAGSKRANKRSDKIKENTFDIRVTGKDVKLIPSKGKAQPPQAKQPAKKKVRYTKAEREAYKASKASQPKPKPKPSKAAASGQKPPKTKERPKKASKPAKAKAGMPAGNGTERTVAINNSANANNSSNRHDAMSGGYGHFDSEWGESLSGGANYGSIMPF
jgi:outer membrane biosynthesis protein TonB